MTAILKTWDEQGNPIVHADGVFPKIEGFMDIPADPKVNIFIEYPDHVFIQGKKYSRMRVFFKCCLNFGSKNITDVALVEDVNINGIRLYYSDIQKSISPEKFPIWRYYYGYTELKKVD